MAGARVHVSDRVRHGTSAWLVVLLLVASVPIAAPALAAPPPVSITKSASPSPVATGGELLYTIVVKNTGGARLNNVVLTETLNGLAALDGVGGLQMTSTVGSCTQSGNNVVCDAGTLAGGQSWTVTIRGKVSAAAGTTLNNTATVTGTKSAQTFSVTKTISTQVLETGNTNLADLTVAVTAPSTTPPDSDFVYQLIVANHGTANATDVALTATLPSAVEFLTVEPTSLFSCTHSGPTPGGTVSCSGGAVNAGSNATIRVGVAAPSTPGNVTIGAAVDPLNTVKESSDLNNAVQSTTNVTDALPGNGLALTKTDTPDPIAPYQTLEYTSTITNTSSNRADYVTFTDGTQGLDASSVSVEASAVGTAVQPTCLVTAPTVTCDVTRFQPGALMTVVVKGIVTTAPGQTVINTATVNGNIKNKGVTSTATTITTVRPARDLTVTQHRTSPTPPEPVRAADEFDYTVTIGNSGLFNAQDVLVRQPLPAGVFFDGVSGGGVTCSITDVGNNILECNVPLVEGLNAAPQGGVTTFVLHLLAPHAVGPITSTVTADPHNAIAENDESNNTFTTTTQVLTGIDLTVTLAQLHNPVIARNGTQRYTITVPNEGTQDAGNIVVRNVLPTGSRYRSAKGDHGFTCSASGQVVTCIGGAVLGTYSGSKTRAVDKATITIDLFAQDEPGNAHDEVRVDPNGAIDEKDESNNIATIDGDVVNGASEGAYINLKFRGDVAELYDPVATNGVLDYTFTVENTGAADAFQVVATVALPAGARFRAAADTAPGDEAFNCSAVGQLITCTGATVLGAGGTRQIHVEAFAPPEPGTAKVQGVLDPANAILESNESDNKLDATTQVISSANQSDGTWIDLSVKSITTNHATVAPDGTLDYDVTIQNTGMADSFDVSFRATLPQGARFRDADDQGGPGDAFSCLAADNVVTCTGAQIPTGGARTVRISVFAPSQPGTYRMDVSVDPTAAIPEGHEGNNSAEKDQQVALGGGGGYIDLQVESVESRGLDANGADTGAVTEVGPGERYAYLIKVKNAGTDDAFNVPFRFIAPTGVVVEQANAEVDSNFLCQQADNVVTCTGGYVKGGGSDVAEITVIAAAPQRHNVLMTSTSSVDPTNEIPEASEVNNLKQQTTKVRSLVDLVAGNAWSGGSANSETSFNATVQNAGTADASDVKFTVSAPVGTILLDAKIAQPTGWACTVYENPVNQVTCTGSTLAAGQTVTLSVKVFVTADSGPTSSTTVADPDGTVVEFDEDNNRAEGTGG